eukprot:CAMPEP_0118646610 /NCGR_PEP_ID=MMETSP0785-20121206/8152_1 /TAXON_ID=91992 /ORGANISM="Bolidomonas pacifica, Strain CCMP 1866" /LENGTH=277 /DNA_ID=CAMNT_0006538623 /DNA_START=212 /DNA_END=1042 /DNA_ORIENTATION=-
MNNTPSTSRSLVFLSCNNPLHPFTPQTTSLWRSIHQINPLGFVWAGDAVYGDELSFDTFPPKRIPATEDKLKSYYDLLLSSPYYPVPSSHHIGTIDDHDSGRNNAGNEWEGRWMAGDLFNAFIDESNVKAGTKEREVEGKSFPENYSPSPRRGVYSVSLFDLTTGLHYPEDVTLPIPTFPLPESGVTGLVGKDTVAVFMLDCRSFKTEWYKGFDFWGTKGLQGDFLGQEQWDWISHLLPRSPATFNVVVNGLQVIPLHRIPNGNLAEDWSKYPVARD